MRLILQVFYCIFSSCLLSLAIPNEWLTFGSPFIAFVALCPYYLAMKKCRSFQESFLLGFIQTFTVHMLSSFWLAFFKDYAVFTLGASALGTGCIGGAFGLLLYIPYSQKKQQNDLNLSSPVSSVIIQSRVVYFAAVYTFYEWVKSSGFLGYPWGTISSCMFNSHHLMQLASITGTYGITFLTVFFTALVSEGFYLIPVIYHSPVKKRILASYKQISKVWIILFAFTMIYGFVQYNKKRTPYKTLTCILVQQNQDPWKVPTDDDSILDSQKLTKERLDELSEQGKKADLVVWSEGILQRAFPPAEYHYSNYPSEKPLKDFIKETGVPFLIGGSYVKRHKDEVDYYNAAHVFDKYGNYRGFYGKNHLVPFAEVIPFTENKFVKAFLEKVVHISAGWTPGNQYTFFEIPCKYYDEADPVPTKTINLNESYETQTERENLPPVTKISTPICFDDSFTDVCRPLYLNGSEVFMNITDDSWSMKKSSEFQHFVIASYRAIEYRTTLVRSTNAGVTSVIDPAGNVLASLPLFEKASLSYDVPVYKRKMTFYARFGNWLPFTIGIFIVIYIIFSIFTFSPTD